MKETAELSEYYSNVAAAVIDEHEDLRWLKKTDVSIGYLGSDREKKSKGRPVLGECILVKDLYKGFIPFDFLIVIYEPNIAELTDEQIRILMYHELLHVGVDEKDGEPVYTVEPHDVEDFGRIIRRYGLGWSEPEEGNADPASEGGNEVTECGKREV